MRRRSRRPRFCLLPALLVVLASAAAMACDVFTPRSHIPAEVVYEYRRQFAPGQLAPGWKLLSVGPNVDDPTQILHRVEVPPALAGELVMESGSARGRRVAEIACPDRSNEIWGELTRRQDVVVVLYTDKGEFDRVSCRSALF